MLGQRIGHQAHILGMYQTQSLIGEQIYLTHFIDGTVLHLLVRA